MEDQLILKPEKDAIAAYRRKHFMQQILDAGDFDAQIKIAEFWIQEELDYGNKLTRRVAKAQLHLIQLEKKKAESDLNG